MSQRIGKTGLAFARVWHHVDVSTEKRSLGRLATSIAITLMGKHKPTYHPSHDVGDYVVVSNCQYLTVTGKKLEQRKYWSHSTKPGHLKLVSMEDYAANKGFGELLKKAVSGMLPKNKLRQLRLDRLKVFDGSEHPYNNNLVAFHDEYKEVEERMKKIADLTSSPHKDA